MPGSAMLNITFGEFRKKTESTEKSDFWAYVFYIFSPFYLKIIGSKSKVSKNYHITVESRKSKYKNEVEYFNFINL